MIDYQVKDPIRCTNAKLQGFVEALYQRMIDRRMTSDFAVNSILAEAEEPFFTRNDDIHAPVGFWRGEFWGKWIISAARACKYEKNEKLEKIIRTSVDKILSTADDNGYIGTYKDRMLILPCKKEDGVKAVGFRCDFCWNIWCQKYTLWGLIEAYELFGEGYVLTAAKKFADQLIDAVRKTGVNPCETGTFFGVASGSILKPMLLLYRHTGDPALLDFSLDIAKGFEDNETKCIKLIKKTLAGIPVHLWNHDNPIAVGRSNATSQKAYEMMSCFEGFCELYRVTGDQKYLDVTEKFYDLIMEYEFNRILTVGFNDRFLYGASVEDAVSEPCDIIHFMRLLAELFLITKNPRYLDRFEAAFLNPFLAGITRDGSWGARAVRSMSYHVTEENVVDMKYNHCCVNNMPRAFETASQMILSQGEDGLYLNFYLPAEITFGKNRITVADGYMRACKTGITYDLDADTVIHLRIPDWSVKTTVTYNGVDHTPMCGAFFPLSLKKGSGKITIAFDSTPRLMGGDYFRDIFPLTPYLKMRYDMHMPTESTKDNRATLMVGPMLLAMTPQLGTAWKEIVERKSVSGRCEECKVEPIDNQDTLACYRVTLKTADGVETFPMCDYATASNRFIPEDFSIFI